MLDPKSNLVAVAVEGVSERESATGLPNEAGLLAIDTAEYYGSQNLGQATQAVYYQLKYSTTTPDDPWTVSGLIDTLQAFATRYVSLCEEIGAPTVAKKIRFRFISNRPIAPSVQEALSAAASATPVAKLSPAAKRARTSLLRGTKLKANEFGKFVAQIDLWGGQEASETQQRGLTVEAGRFTAFLDTDASMRMKELVRQKALSKSQNDKVIDLNTLLRQFGLGTIDELMPCSPKFEVLAKPIRRAQEAQITRTILTSAWPIVICAPGGVGKSVFGQQIPKYLPAGSEAVVFDGFAGGDYRNRRLHRHKHARGLVHIANELASRGLCDVLIPQQTATALQYLGAFRMRLEQAVAAISARSSDAVLLIVIDAADNLGMAAEDENERSFVPDLLAETPPKGCHIVALARTERVKKYLNPAAGVVSIALEPFDLDESTTHLRSKFPAATDQDAGAFDRFTDHNPRVQANALAVANDLPALLKSLGPVVQTVDHLIASQLKGALDKVVAEQASSFEEVQPLCIALAALSPPMPLSVLAKASAMSEEAVRSFISDFANGRPIILVSDTAQFRDEPVETWFKDNYLGTSEKAGAIADLLAPMASENGYVAGVLPILLHRARRYDELVRLALENDGPKTDDPVEKREILLHRVQYALKGALTQNRLDDATKLLLRAGEEVAINDRQSGFLIDNADLVSSLAGADVVSDFIFRRRPWEFLDQGYIYCAVMLASSGRSAAEADQFLSLAMSWLREWYNKRKEEPQDDLEIESIKIGKDDLAAYAEVIRRLHGSEDMMKFFKHWRDWFVLEVSRIVVSRLLDRGERKPILDLLAASGNRLAVRLAIIGEMNTLGIVPPAKEVRLTVSLLLDTVTAPDLNDFPNDSTLWSAVAAVAETATVVGIARSKIQALLDRYQRENERVFRQYDGEGRRDVVLRTRVLRAIIHQQLPTLQDVAPTSVLKAQKEKGADNDRGVREFKSVYGALLPWYVLRARSITGQITDWDESIEVAKKECRTDSYGWGDSSEQIAAVNEIGVMWFDAGVWAGVAPEKLARDVEQWLGDQKVMITVPTWTRLARRASHLVSACHDGALKFAWRARELIESEHGDARMTADMFATIARAVLPLGTEESTGYFQKGLEHLNRLGDELRERQVAILSLAHQAGKSGRSNPREAYRVARMGELFNEYNNHKFPWPDVAEAVARLCPTSSFAIASRWNDRGRVSVGDALPWIALHLVEAKKLGPRTAAALHALGGYWRLSKLARTFFDNEPEHAFRQMILDALAFDQEFDPASEDNSVSELLAVARERKLDCHHLQARANYQTQLPSSERKNYKRTDNAEPESVSPPNWQATFKDIDLHTVEGVDEATRRRRDLRQVIPQEEFLAAMRQAVDAPRRQEHVMALAQSEELHIGSILDAIEACAGSWSSSFAVEKSATKAVKYLTSDRIPELVGRGWALKETVRRCAALAKTSTQEVLYCLMSGMADQVEHVSAGSLFNLAGALAASALTPEQAEGALGFALDRIEIVLKSEDGDGPWSESLLPPTDTASAVAGLVYAMLAAPETQVRWRGAHVVRRLCRFGEKDVLGALVSLLPSETLPAFTDRDLPFYGLHARLYLLIALARVAQETPNILIPHANDLIRWAQEPHVLIRHFATRALLDLSRASPGLLEQETIDRLLTVNVSQFAAVETTYEQRHKTPGKSEAQSERFTLDYDFDRYWLEPLANAFNLPNADVVDRTLKWIVDEWGQGGKSAWDSDPRARRSLYGGDYNATHASHGSYPTVDRHSFYLSYHAMFCTAGELLAQFPPSRAYGGNGWESWLSQHGLIRSDGKWLVDRRDPDPLDIRPWETEEDDWNRRDEWKFSILGSDFDQILGLHGEETKKLAVWGWWYVLGGQRKETISVRSALVTRPKSLALLRALQTASNSHDYGIPAEGRELESDLPEFQFCGWLSDPERCYGLDRFDPFAGDISWPGYRPGRRVRRLFRLTQHSGGRTWHDKAAEVISVQIWGDRKETRYKSALNNGDRMTVNLDFLLRALRRLDRDLIIKVEIERANGSKTEDEIAYEFRPYARLYLLRGTGEIFTIHGRTFLRQDTSS
jgi:hypothetical protein